ncbi:septation protein SepH [Salinibacterium sp. ZJ70]|uniref:septation protein SepH n=1 Tax=Salinibacterium sp. ZJ70 TaxID=2708084 RepID=UPI001422CD1F|nr:septation protein SepH [Salinibacterium sp. ZJ70]
MQELKVIGVENGSLLVASGDGERYRVEVDEALLSRLRASMPEPGPLRRLAPREIQAQIRAGLTADDVARVTGASVEYVRRFEGPVIAEREYVVESALNVPVHMAVETDPLASGATFGSVIRERLAESGAQDERWSSWKEQGGGWIVKLTFSTNGIDHDARWGFEPKKQSLSPLNQEAVTLSQQGELPQSLVPRLRAVPVEERDDSRFDSGAFTAEELGRVADDGEIAQLEFGGRPAPADEAPGTHHTADLLEALRRRRGEREPLDLDEADAGRASHPSTGVVKLIDIPLDVAEELPAPAKPAPQQTAKASGSSGATGPLGKRRGRASMPSWDEIVFGARTDDDL